MPHKYYGNPKTQAAEDMPPPRRFEQVWQVLRGRAGK
jgi:hypothetical protein